MNIEADGKSNAKAAPVVMQNAKLQRT